MGTSRPWRRDAWWWSIKYGVLTAVGVFLYVRRMHPDPAASWQASIWHDATTGLGWGVLAAVIIFVVRWRGSLVDLDELHSVGRGGLGLGRTKQRNQADSANVPDDTPRPPGAA